MYFTLKKARSLITKNLESLTDLQLQETIVKLRDFHRYTSDTHLYFDILLKGGYFRSATTHASSGVSPKDIWLQQNLSYKLDVALKERKQRIQKAR